MAFNTRTRWIFGAVGFVVLGLVLFFVRLANKISTGVFLGVWLGLLGLVLFIIILRAVILNMLKGKQKLPASLLPPALDKDQVIEGVRRYLTQSWCWPYHVDSKNKWSYPQGSFVVGGEHPYLPGRITYYVFEIFITAPARKHEIWTVRVLANQTFEQICKGNNVGKWHKPLVEFERRPREFPDVPIIDERMQQMSQFLNALDPDALRSNPDLLLRALPPESSFGMPQARVEGMETAGGSEGGMSDAELSRSNVYSRPLPNKRRFRR